MDEHILIPDAWNDQHLPLFSVLNFPKVKRQDSVFRQTGF
jgi:hypothetical protein